MVINKPAGMIVNRSDTAKDEYTLQDWLADYFVDKLLPRELRLGIVHRLDKETAGLMVVAKTEKGYHHLTAQFKERKVKKNYIALVHGQLQPAAGDIHLPIKRDPRNRKKFTVFVGGKMAITEYKTRQVYANVKEKNRSKKYFSLLEIDLKTGRTHQIRVHFSHLRHPVVADPVYAGKKTSRSDRGWCSHIFLQSSLLGFWDPEGKWQLFSLQLNPELQTALDQHLQSIGS
jgi:23S rRNA pseudouridine1911/1915/1917 synthase